VASAFFVVTAEERAPRSFLLSTAARDFRRSQDFELLAQSRVASAYFVVTAEERALRSLFSARRRAIS
jgi:hypothetical protein